MSEAIFIHYDSPGGPIEDFRRVMRDFSGALETVGREIDHEAREGAIELRELAEQLRRLPASGRWFRIPSRLRARDVPASVGNRHERRKFVALRRRGR